jgi:mannose-1-phosphate guanylyltransferase
MRANDYVIIMAGGIGSRFWPLSRHQNPKQFHDVLGTGKTLIQMTWERFSGFVPEENIFVVTNRQYVPLVQTQLPGIRPENILAEPVSRNTAPTILYACHKIRKLNPDACFFVAASDHLIMRTDRFLEDVSLGLDECRQREIIMTLGVRPTRPDTGYGYIQFNEAESNRFSKVKLFTEKPNLEMAQTFLRSGDFLWNSGMFIFSLATIFKAFLQHLPEMSELFQQADSAMGTEKESEAMEQVFAKCKNISFDIGLMEKVRNVYVIPSSFDWSDLGTWTSVYENVPQDYLGNASQGRAIVFNSSGNLMVTTQQGKLIVVDGLNDFVIVDTRDALLIFRRGEDQQVREIVAEVKKQFGDQFI